MDKDEKEFYKVEEIANPRRVIVVVQYGMQWTGCTKLADTCEMFDNVDNHPKKV